MMHLPNMKRNILSLLLAAAALLTLAPACHQVDPDPDPEEITFTYGAYFLDAGATENSEITQLNTLWATVTPRCFSLANDGKKLGEGGRDIRIFGQKMYVTLAASRRVCVINKNNCQELGSFTIRDDDGNLLTPSHLADFEGALLVSLAEGYVASVDTVSYQVRALQKIGESGGCLIVADQKLYAANPSSNTIQMLNPVDLHLMKTIEVQKNPRSFTVGSGDKNLYCVAGRPETALFQIDSDTDEAVEVPSVVQPQIAAAGPDNSLIIYVLSDADETGGKYYVLNLDGLKVEGEFIRDGSYVKDPTGLFIDQNTGNVYISQDGAGDFSVINIYTSYGQYISSFNTGNAHTMGAAFVTGK
jgi:hypothetical protein